MRSTRQSLQTVCITSVDGPSAENVADYPHGLPVMSIASSLGNVGSSTESEWVGRIASLYNYPAWNTFMASTFGDSTRSQILDALWTCANMTSDAHPFGAIFDVASGSYQNGTSRFVHL